MRHGIFTALAVTSWLLGACPGTPAHASGPSLLCDAFYEVAPTDSLKEYVFKWELAILSAASFSPSHPASPVSTTRLLSPDAH